VSRRFLAASDAGAKAPEAVIVGVPVDGGVSFRPGAALAPAAIREFSDSIESYSPRAERDLEDLALVDAGDIDDPVEAGAIVVPWPSALPVFIGGDHSITPKLVASVAARTEGLAVIGFDAHLDFREEYPGDHACTYRRISDAGVPCYVFGPRSGERSEWVDAPKILALLSRDLDVSKAIEDLRGRPVYVTLDIDVLDPSVAPGTGNPEAGGPGFNELLEAIESLATLDVVACDVVEVSPPLDPSGITQAAAAVLVREMILNFVRR
jgi:agmatinase